jgi:hypothetical protein
MKIYTGGFSSGVFLSAQTEAGVSEGRNHSGSAPACGFIFGRILGIQVSRLLRLFIPCLIIPD